MAATIVTRQAQEYHRHGQEVLYIAPTAAQTFLKGQFLKVVSGKLTAHVTAAGTSELYWFFSLGPAVDPVTSVLNTLVPVLRVKPGLLFEMTFEGTSAQTDIGLSFGLKVTSGINTILKSDTTNIGFMLMELPNDSVNGVVTDINVRGIFEVLPAHIG
jgi:hypothetical protein